VESNQHVNGGGLSGTVWSQKTQEGIRLNRQAELVDSKVRVSSGAATAVGWCFIHLAELLNDDSCVVWKVVAEDGFSFSSNIFVHLLEFSFSEGSSFHGRFFFWSRFAGPVRWSQEVVPLSAYTIGIWHGIV